MPIDTSRYPKDWKLRSRFVRFYRAKNKCEWCGAENHKPHPVTGSRVVLTTAHVYDKNPMAASLLNLAALCQRCHLNHDKFDRHRTDADKMIPTNCREFIHKRIKRAGHAKVAAMMGYTESDLTRRLRQKPGDPRRLTCDDFERYVQATGDIQPIMYLADKYDPTIRPRLIAYLRDRLHTLQMQSAQGDLFA